MSAAEAFSARVAALPSPAAELLVRKNNLSFVDLLQPFCRLSAEGQVKDPVSGNQCSVKKFKLSISHVNSRPPQPTLARKFLNESVSNNYSDKTISRTIGNFHLEIPASTPWFEAWRETFFQVQFPSDHEFTKHFVACLLVVSTSEANPLETMAHMSQQLSQMQNVTPPKLPKWFNSNVLRSYVFLHDNVEGNIDKTKRNYEILKDTYGAGNCFLICINSRNPNENDNCVLPDPWSKFLTRRHENNDSGCDKDSLPRTPADVSVVSGMPINVMMENQNKDGIATPPSDSSSIVICESATEASEMGAVTVQIHPLSPSEDIESSIAFDSANSLQNDAMSNSGDSESGLMNPNVWEPTSTNGVGIVHGACLTTQDIENIRMFVQDFALKALLPYFERQIFQLQDIVSNKKGVSRSLFNATKRWFGTNKPGTNMPVNSVIYSNDCAEMQLRRLGDIWFMLGQWTLAFQAYHSAKREYSSDGAWLCYAGALEMAALSDFMAYETPRKTHEYMDESILKYLNNCRMPQYAVRTTLLSVQCLCSKGFFGEAARQLIRMTSEDCDLRSAVLLEQAALCFVAESCKKMLPRKFAFHMVLAGHRYSKAGQRKHSLRCYKHAYQVYKDVGWRLATDHIEFSVGRLAGQVRDWDASASALASLLAPRSLQSPIQQTVFLREYLHILQQWISSESEQKCLPQLPIPLLESNLTAILCGGIPLTAASGRTVASGTTLNALPSPDKPWSNLEEMLMHKAKGSPVMIFKPTLSLFCKTTDNSSNPIVPQNESIQVLVHFKNTLQIDINILDVQLLWEFKSESSNQSNEILSNEDCIIQSTEYDKAIMLSRKEPEVSLVSDKITPVTMSLTPLKPGKLTIIGVSYRLCSPVQTSDGGTSSGISVLGKQIFEVKGPKLKSAKEGSGELQYGIDNRLNIIVTPPSPCLQVTFSEINNELLCGELQRISVEFRNVGHVPLKSLYMGTSHPQYISLSAENENDTDPFAVLFDSMYLKPPLVLDERQMIIEKDRRIRNRHCIKVLDTLGAEKSYTTTLFLQAPEQIGSHKLHVLFYYENTQTNCLPKHRLLRHSWNILLKESIQLSAVARRSLRPDQDLKYKEALNLAVEVKNANQISHGILTSLDIQQASLLSQCWKLTSFVPINQDVKLLSSQETMHIIMCAQRDCVKNSEKDVLYSDINFESNNNLVSIKEKPYSSFITNFASVFNDHEIMNDTYMLDNNNLDNESINSTLIVRWKADITENRGNQRTALGQHRLILDKLNIKVSSLASADVFKLTDGSIKLFGTDMLTYIPGMSSSVNLPVDERLVTFCLEHQLEFKHDFSKHCICLVPVKIHLVNCSLKTVMAVLNTSSPKSFSDKCRGVGWVGAGGNETGGVEVALDSLESKTVSLEIACTSPGTYSLGSIIRVSCKVKQDDVFSNPILQGHITSSTLIVTQAASNV